MKKHGTEKEPPHPQKEGKKTAPQRAKEEIKKEGYPLTKKKRLIMKI